MCLETFDLSCLPVGSSGTILSIDACGLEKDRFLDLGFAPSVTVTTLFKSPAQNPTAYEIMGAVLALRSEDACKIIVQKDKNVV
ncbi:MAG: ferrous iron transport protein A [Firmicutes bacterium]|nr:ferrous iron transport protein A [Bacillota bacterium]